MKIVPVKNLLKFVGVASARRELKTKSLGGRTRDARRGVRVRLLAHPVPPTVLPSNPDSNADRAGFPERVRHATVRPTRASRIVIIAAIIAVQKNTLHVRRSPSVFAEEERPNAGRNRFSPTAGPTTAANNDYRQRPGVPGLRGIV